MDLIDRINQIAARLEGKVASLSTEEATKNAAVMPILNALGYDVFDPSVVVPEFTADVGTKKGEKVDYAILKDGKPIILMECKSVGSTLSLNHASQLFRYFSVVDARVSILTNGVIYKFYTDIEKINKMDEKPFFEFNLFDFEEKDIAELKKFSSSNFDIDDILSNASELKYRKQIKSVISAEFEEPSEEFVKCLTDDLYDGRFTLQVKERFTVLVKEACSDFLKDSIKTRFESVWSDNETDTGGLDAAQEEVTVEKVDDVDRGIVTTEEEVEAFHIVRAILSQHISPERIVMRDTKSYCGVLLDDNNRKPICRFHFNTSNLYFGFFKEKKIEEKVPVNSVLDIYAFAGDLIRTLDFYND